MTGHTALIARLRLLNNPAVRKRTMEFWDSWRRAIADGESGSWPRDAFEGILDEFVEMGGDAADALEGHEAELAALIEDVNARGVTMAKQDEALEEAEMVIEPFVALCDEIEQCAASTTDDAASDPRNWVKACQWDDLIAVRNWRDQYGRRL